MIVYQSLQGGNNLVNWEIDLVLPTKQNNGQYQDHSAIMVVVERKTRFYGLIKVKSKQSKDMIEAFKLFYERYGKAVKTITSDNGSKFISWDFLEYVQKELKIKLYYCTLSSPHQRVSNEKRNGKLRDWFPKGTSFRSVRQKQLDDVSDKMNAIPMIIALQGKNPIELFDKEYKTMQRYSRAYKKIENELNRRSGYISNKFYQFILASN